MEAGVEANGRNTRVFVHLVKFKAGKGDFGNAAIVSIEDYLEIILVIDEERIAAIRKIDDDVIGTALRYAIARTGSHAGERIVTRYDFGKSQHTACFDIELHVQALDRHIPGRKKLNGKPGLAFPSRRIGKGADSDDRYTIFTSQYTRKNHLIGEGKPTHLTTTCICVQADEFQRQVAFSKQVLEFNRVENDYVQHRRLSRWQDAVREAIIKRSCLSGCRAIFIKIFLFLRWQISGKRDANIRNGFVQIVEAKAKVEAVVIDGGARIVFQNHTVPDFFRGIRSVQLLQVGDNILRAISRRAGDRSYWIFRKSAAIVVAGSRIHEINAYDIDVIYLHLDFSTGVCQHIQMKKGYDIAQVADRKLVLKNSAGLFITLNYPFKLSFIEVTECG